MPRGKLMQGKPAFRRVDEKLRSFQSDLRTLNGQFVFRDRASVGATGRAQSVRLFYFAAKQ
jgi:hypothetical protein